MRGQEQQEQRGGTCRNEGTGTKGEGNVGMREQGQRGRDTQEQGKRNKGGGKRGNEGTGTKGEGNMGMRGQEQWDQWGTMQTCRGRMSNMHVRGEWASMATTNYDSIPYHCHKPLLVGWKGVLM